MTLTTKPPAMRRVAFEIKTLTYDDMMIFAQGLAEVIGVHELNPTGNQGDELTTEVIAASISAWVDEHLEDEDT